MKADAKKKRVNSRDKSKKSTKGAKLKKGKKIEQEENFMPMIFTEYEGWESLRY
jgi:hypothetical protein